MKVYVSELPKNCFECPCFRNDIDFPCGLSDGTKDYFLDDIDGGECPLKSLVEHDKQVRKEVCEEIKEKSYKDSEFYNSPSGGISERSTYLINEHILDQIQIKKK